MNIPPTGAKMTSKINTYKFDINYQPREFVNLEEQAQEMQD